MVRLGRSRRLGALVGLALAIATLIQFGVSGPVLAASQVDPGESSSSTAQTNFSRTTQSTGLLNSTVTSIDSRGAHNCLVVSGAAKCWGNNFFATLGDGTSTDRVTPVQVSGLTDNVVAVTAGGIHSCALLASGGVKCWGDNRDGQLGDGTTQNRATPVQVVGLESGVKQIVASGYSFTCAILISGAAQCWGDNSWGQLGDGTKTQRSTPVQVKGLTSGVLEISTFGPFACALTSARAVQCWGAQFDSSTPVQVPGWTSGVAHVSAGNGHLCALMQAGDVQCWGDNAAGGLGDGTTTSRYLPVQVFGLSSGVASISSGADRSCALLNSGAVQCWGVNDFGQMGDGTTINRLTPIQVTGLTGGVQSIAVGGQHSCALLTSGSIKCWGGNWSGQLGSGVPTDYSVTPIDLAWSTFAATPTPQITGPVQADLSVGSSAGTWEPMPDSISYSWESGTTADGPFSPIPGAAGDSLTPAPALVGSFVRVTVVAVKAGLASISRSSTAIEVKAGGTFPQELRPTITGTQQPGSQLTALPGNWPTATTFTYQWMKSTSLLPALVPISGATSPTYTIPSTAPLGDRYTVRLVARKTGYVPVTRDSETSGNSFRSVPIPTISGTMTVGSVLTVNQGMWLADTGNQADSFEIQWFAGNQIIPLATGRQYTLTTAEFGDKVRVEVTGIEANWGRTSRSSALTSTVLAGTNQIATVSLQYGSLTPGNEIKAIIDGFTDARTIQWFRGTTRISGADADTYVIASADVGSRINVTVTEATFGFVPITKNAVTPTAITSNLFVATPVPNIVGDASIGSTLSVDTPEWTPAVDTLTYQWLRNGLAIPGAIDAEYVLVASDVDKTISVTVTGEKVGYTSVSKTSQSTDPVTGYTWDSEPASADIVVTGTYKVGEQLVAATPTWGPSQATTVSYQWFRGIDPISNATAASYVLTPADKGYYVTVKMTARHLGYSESLVQSPGFGTIGVVQPGTFEAPLPLITGNFSVGGTLTANAPAVSGVSTTVAYQWQRNGVDILNATARTYVIAAADLGAFISVKVLYSASGYVPANNLVVGSKSVSAKFVPPTAAQLITGGTAPKVGQTLTATEGTWTPTPASYNYVWKIAITATGTYTNIPDATARTYVVKPADVGKFIKVEFAGVKANYDLSPQLSAATGVVGLGTMGTVPTPTVSGTKVVGDTVTANEGSWPVLPDSFTYVWKRGTTTISGAAGKMYVLQPADRGQSITVLVTGLRAGFTSATSAPSAAFTGVVAPFTTAQVPTIVLVSGDGDGVKVGTGLRAFPGTWSPAPAFTYVWKRNGVAISGATASTYTAVAADLGAAITVAVTGTLSTYVTTTKESAATANVAKGVLGSGTTPSITGNAVTGATLTAVPGTWGPVQDSFTYQWTVGDTPVAAPLGSGATYVVQLADLGKSVTVTVTAKKAGYDDMSKTSLATALVTLPLIATAPTPTITPTTALKVGATLTANPGAIPAGATVKGYQWSRGTGSTAATAVYANIPDATLSSYVLTGTDLAKFLKVTVIWSKAGNADTPKLSAATIAIAGGTFATSPAPVPTITGTLTVGETLTANSGTWSPTPDSFIYTWWSATSAGGTYTAISGASGRTYVLKATDRSKFIKVEVKAVKTGYTTSIAFRSAATTVIN